MYGECSLSTLKLVSVAWWKLLPQQISMSVYAPIMRLRNLSKLYPTFFCSLKWLLKFTFIRSILKQVHSINNAIPNACNNGKLWKPFSDIKVSMSRLFSDHTTFAVTLKRRWEQAQHWIQTCKSFFNQNWDQKPFHSYQMLIHSKCWS